MQDDQKKPPFPPPRKRGTGVVCSAAEGVQGVEDLLGTQQPPPPCFARSTSRVALRSTGEDIGAAARNERRHLYTTQTKPR
jgi:hypothetical protein